ncbi:MAG TPA: acetate kinase, partial [Bacteroidia bacterium]|nr:acetate kinase [Bacteroidia bacterium]
MPSEEVITKGIFERIGLEKGIFSISVGDEKQTTETEIPDHSVAVKILLTNLTELGIIKSLDE